MAKTVDGPGFRITDKKGFHIAFANGYTVSVQFGPGSYCDDDIREMRIGRDEEKAGQLGSATAETAVFADAGLLDYNDSGDTVQGFQTPEQVLELMIWASKQPAPVTSEAAAE